MCFKQTKSYNVASGCIRVQNGARLGCDGVLLVTWWQGPDNPLNWSADDI